MTRPVTVYEWWRPDGAKCNDPFQKREIGQGVFHHFGVDFEEREFGVASYSTAIVEMPDGTVTGVSLELIKFDD